MKRSPKTCSSRGYSTVNIISYHANTVTEGFFK